MGGKLPKVYEDYVALAKSRDLEFIGSTTPETIKHSTMWRCCRCGRTIRKSYDNTKQHKNGCICWSKSLQIEDYQALGEKLGIQWVALEFVPNISTKTMWKSKRLGVYFSASYRQLAYDRIPKELQIYVTAQQTPEPF